MDPEPSHLEAHLLDLNTGHLCDGTECWCEPDLFWLQNADEQWIHVITHSDVTTIHHKRVIKSRDVKPDWVTILLNDVAEATGEPV